MLYSSLIFIYGFLPTVLFIYFLLNKRYRNLFLILSSLLFYTWGEGLYVFIMLFSTVVDYICGIIISGSFSESAEQLLEDGQRNFRQKIGLILSITTNLSLLIFFKYANFGIENINSLMHLFGYSSQELIKSFQVALPLGISFYTFQSMSYTIDVYRGKVRTTKNFLDFLAYVSLFPQLVAGPIVRYKDIEDQLRSRDLKSTKFAEGVQRFIVGLGKKIVLANVVAELADKIFIVPSEQLTFSVAWLGVICYTFQIYFDFSGYSDMAIGLGKMLGFDFSENFNYPYISKSVQEFWRRWHISLSTWFRDYLYIPLGGSKVSSKRTYLNLFIVFTLCGFWHGASWNFLVWGFFHGFFLTLERTKFKIILNRLGYFKHVYLIIVVIIGWVFFRAENLQISVGFFKAMFGLNGFNNDIYNFNMYINRKYLYTLILCIIGSTPFLHNLKLYFMENELKHRFMIFNNLIKVLELSILIFIFFYSTAQLTTDVYNPFIYFRF